VSRLADIFRFSRPKGPGYGISREFYLSVLAATARLPAILDVIEPAGAGGAIKGFGAPLREGASKDELGRPMERGAYVLASPDRKTVLKLLVVPKDEAGFDPDALLSSQIAASIPPELFARIRATWTLLQLAFEAHDPEVFPSVDFLLDVASRLGALTGGAVADPLSEAYHLPERLRVGAQRPIDASNVVRVVWRPPGYAFTLGMRKFALPEFEIDRLASSDGPLAERFLYGLCQGVLVRGPLEPGDRVGSRRAPLLVGEGGLDRARWEGVAVYELLPVKGADVSAAMRSWAEENG
jgi:hypothetical protein